MNEPDRPAVITAQEQLGQAIRRRRKASRIRIDAAADLVGVSADALSRLENGKGARVHTLLKALRGLGLSLILAPNDSPLVVELRRDLPREPTHTA